MTHQSPRSSVPAEAPAGRQVAQLREVLFLVRRIAGQSENRADRDFVLDEAARISSFYDRALPVVQRRFDALAGEAAGWAAAGVEALLAAGESAPPRAAAARLASQLDLALLEMKRLLEPAAPRSAIPSL